MFSKLPPEIIEKIAFINGDVRIFYTLLNSTPVLIRRKGLHERAVQRFTVCKVHKFEQKWYLKGWFLNGKLHRENDLPAIICADGTQEWYFNGNPHRENDQPALISANGRQEWCLNGELHRENDLPAVIWPNGTQKWFLNGKLHRKNDLPALIWPDGTQRWFLNDEEYEPTKRRKIK